MKNAVVCFHFSSDHSQTLREEAAGGRVVWSAGSLHTGRKCILTITSEQLNMHSINVHVYNKRTLHLCTVHSLCSVPKLYTNPGVDLIIYTLNFHK